MSRSVETMMAASRRGLVLAPVAGLLLSVAALLLGASPLLAVQHAKTVNQLQPYR